MKKKPLEKKWSEFLYAKREDFIAQIRELKSQVSALNRKGVLLAHPQYKKGTTTMYLLEPRDGAGKRKYHYIGADKKDQQEAVAKIGRYHRRNMILEAVDGLERFRMQIDSEIANLGFSLGSSLRQGEEALKVSAAFTWKWGDMVTGSSSSRPRSVTSKTKKGGE